MVTITATMPRLLCIAVNLLSFLAQPTSELSLDFEAIPSLIMAIMSVVVKKVKISITISVLTVVTLNNNPAIAGDIH